MPPTQRKPTIDRASRQFRIRRDILEAIDEFADECVVGPNFVIETAVQFYFQAVNDGTLPWPGPLRKPR